jgi:hypothetical protein
MIHIKEEAVSDRNMSGGSAKASVDEIASASEQAPADGISRASEKAPADEISRASEKAPADEMSAEELNHMDWIERMQEAQAALIWGFLNLLHRAFPERYDPESDVPPPLMKQVVEDIEHVSGCKLKTVFVEPPETYKSWKEAFDAFGKQHKMTDDSCICFHGSSLQSLHQIHNHGFDPQRYRQGQYGNGAYVTQYITEALVYAVPDSDGFVWLVFGRAHVGDPRTMPVGSPGQTDFGVRADGTPIVTLTNPLTNYFCLSDPKQFISSGIIGFSIDTDTRPSDLALTYMMYPPAVWKRMTERIPGLVAYKQRLVAAAKRKHRKACRRAAWAKEVGSREQPQRAVKRERDGAAKRERDA